MKKATRFSSYVAVSVLFKQISDDIALIWHVCRILKVLLNELIDQSVEKKQPKLMLRR